MCDRRRGRGEKLLGARGGRGGNGVWLGRLLTAMCPAFVAVILVGTLHDVCFLSV